MSTYTSAIDYIRELKQKHGNWQNISETDGARMMVQNRFKTVWTSQNILLTSCVKT